MTSNYLLDVSDSKTRVAAEARPGSLIRYLNVQVFAAGFVSLAPGRWDHDRLSTSHWRLYHHDKPGGSLFADGKEYAVEPERVYLIPPGQHLASRCDSPFRQFYLHFDLTGFSSIALGDLFPNPVAVPVSKAFASAVAELGSQITNDWRGNLALDCWMKGVVCEAVGRYLVAVSPERLERYELRVSALHPVLPAIRRIEQHLGEVLTNGELAALCNLSEDHFIRRFAAAAGVPPSRYIAQRRIALAAQLLLFSDHSLEHIAAVTGFRDRFYFSRVFARATGTPPAAFRRGGR